mgnify:CR=1 FL=1
MKRTILSLLLILGLTLSLLGGCGVPEISQAEDVPYYGDGLQLIEDAASALDAIEQAEQDRLDEIPSAIADGTADEPASGAEAVEYPSDIPEELQIEELPTVTEDGSYTSPAEVATYLHEFGHLPGNYITKAQAKALGWESSKGNLWDVAPGKSIGGDRFGNYEGLLPEGSYQECDVNYAGGFRGAERLIFGTDGSVYYTSDHYASFIRLF